MSTIYNFAAGPSMLPKSVLLRAQKELLNWNGTGISIMETGHRTPAFQTLLANVEQKLRQLMAIPTHYRLLFLAGGGQGHFSFIPMNLTRHNRAVDYLLSGIWSERAAKYAARYADVRVIKEAHIAVDEQNAMLNPDAAYVYYCPNETINGIQFNQIPNTGKVPLIADMTSSILSHPIDVTQFGLIFAAAQKNLGITGITLLIIRDDLLNQYQECVPELFNYTLQSEQHSLLNTIPTLPVYMMDLMLDWMIDDMGGLGAITNANARKVRQLYECIDCSRGFYSNPVDPTYRSQINVPFNLPNDALLQLFLKEADAQGLSYLSGHKLVGGARASLYNAMPEEGVHRLVEFMQQFAARHTQRT